MGGTQQWPRSVGGHVALDFVNTDVVSQHDRSTDILRSAEEFLAWCDNAGLAVDMPASFGRSREANRVLVAKAGELRTAIRAIVEAIVERRTADSSDLRRLQSVYADAVKRAVPTFHGGQLTWTWDAASPDAVISDLAHASAASGWRRP
jgi:predicted RNA-binding Zn ribbon-like protein